MPDKAILIAPALLVVWSMAMLIWAAIDRWQTFGKAKIDIAKAPPGARGQDLQSMLPPGSDWPAHNYVHLMEQPTVYYAACVILAIGGPTGYDYTLAWAYLVLRVIHSVYQAKINVVKIRAAIFVLSSVVMLILSLRALLSVLD